MCPVRPNLHWRPFGEGLLVPCRHVGVPTTIGSLGREGCRRPNLPTTHFLRGGTEVEWDTSRTHHRPVRPLSSYTVGVHPVVPRDLPRREGHCRFRLLPSTHFCVRTPLPETYCRASHPVVLQGGRNSAYGSPVTTPSCWCHDPGPPVPRYELPFRTLGGGTDDPRSFSVHVSEVSESW